jgi:hypothetical protein
MAPDPIAWIPLVKRDLYNLRWAQIPGRSHGAQAAPEETLTAVLEISFARTKHLFSSANELVRANAPNLRRTSDFSLQPLKQPEHMESVVVCDA